MSDALEHKRRLTKRRRQILSDTPAHYCPACTVLAYAQDDACLECEWVKPDKGWPDLRDSMDPWLGRQIENRYLLTKRIGQGASASVYRAESLAISRQFAIKLINPPKSTGGPSAEQIAGRLEREVEAIGRLRNPHVVHFYDVIELPLNHIGVVMDFVEGDTVELEVEQHGPMTVARTCSLLRQIANGVYEAHLTGMTHRDLKPENIMIERLPAGDDFVHVLDFGIVHMEGEVNMTQGFIGTPLYASPEQAMGEEVDARSDIYSLGAITFFMLTGRPPFSGQNVMQVLRQHVEEAPPLISTYRSDMVVPDDLEMLVRRMLAKTPADRPQTLAEVIHHLDKLSYATIDDRATHYGGELDKASHLTSPGGARTAPLSGPRAPSVGSSTSQGLPHVESAPLLDEAPGGYSNSGHIPPQTLDNLSSVGEELEPAMVPLLPNASEGAYERPTPPSGIFGKMRKPRSSSKILPPKPRHITEGTHPGAAEFGQISLDSFGSPRIAKLGPEHCFLTVTNELNLWCLQPRRHRTFSLSSVDEITALAMSRKSAIIGRASGVIEHIDLKTGYVKELFRSVFSDPVCDLTINHAGHVMIAVMDSGRIYMSSQNREADDWVRVRGGSAATAIRLDHKNDLFAVAREDGLVEISRISEPKNIRIRLETDIHVDHMAFSEDGYLFAVIERGDTRVRLFQVINGKHLIDVGTEGSSLLAIEFSPSNELLGYLKDGDRVFVRSLQSLN